MGCCGFLVFVVLVVGVARGGGWGVSGILMRTINNKKKHKVAGTHAHITAYIDAHTNDKRTHVPAAAAGKATTCASATPKSCTPTGKPGSCAWASRRKRRQLCWGVKGWGWGD